jgi:multicomponent Na+:H+ antiporter subunit D
MILAGALDTLGVYAVARIYWTVFASPFAGHNQAIQAVLISVGAVSAIVAGILALTFQGPRRRLAFVMVAHTGILLIGVGCLSARGIAAAAVYAVGDGTVKAGLWAAFALLGLTQPADDEQPAPYLTRTRRRTGLTLLTAGALATAGLPLFATGLGKASIEDAAAAAGYPWVAPIVVIAAALTGAALLSIAWSWTRQTTRPSAAGGDNRDGWWMSVAACSGVLLGLSAAATFMGRWAAVAATRFVDTTGYQQRVLDGARGIAATAPALQLSARGAVLDLLAVAAAMALAAGISRAPVGFRQRLNGPTVRRLHDGSIGDSATWATVGTAAIALLFAFGLH